MMRADTAWRRRAQRACIPLAVVVVLSLTGCTASPETTVVEGTGEERTVQWKDYPGHASTDQDTVLEAPSPEAAERRALRILTEIEAALTEAYGLGWSSQGESGWFEYSGNGYGGDSYLTTYNSSTRVSDGVPNGKESWREALDLIDEILVDDGLGGLVLHHDFSTATDEEAWPDEAVEKFGSSDEEQFWQWSADSVGESQWVSVTLSDVAQDRTGQAAEVLEDMGLERESVAISYGVTTVPSDHRDEFRRALEPFEGLQTPEGTHSD